ncbi:MAG: hypothetical protein ACTSUE_27720 [Promethearchaeota archaeon]
MVKKHEKEQDLIVHDLAEDKSLLKSVSAVTFIGTYTSLIYVLSLGNVLLTNITIPGLIVYFPSIFIMIVIPLVSVIGITSLRNTYARDGIKYKIFKVFMFVSLSIAFVIFIYELIYCNVENDGLTLESITTRNTIIVSIHAALLACSITFLYKVQSLQNQKVSRKNLSKFPEEEMGVRKIFSRGIFFLRTRYWQLLLVFMGAFILGRLINFLVFAPWERSIYLETRAITEWLTENNYYQGMPSTPEILAINQRINNLTLNQQVYLILNTSVASTVFYVAFGIAVQIVIKAYRGADPTISRSLKQVKTKLIHLIIISFVFSVLYNLGLKILIIPGIIFYVFTIMVFPNVTIVGKYKIFENFGRSKDLLKNNIMRMGLFSLILIILKVLSQSPLEQISNQMLVGLGKEQVLKDWLLDPWGNAGSYIVYQVLDGMIRSAFGPVEAVFVAIMFIDLRARGRNRIANLKKSKDVKALANASKQMTYNEKVKRATYCPECGFSVKLGRTRCPNCKAKMIL